jgi:hypothetical protein
VPVGEPGLPGLLEMRRGEGVAVAPCDRRSGNMVMQAAAEGQVGAGVVGDRGEELFDVQRYAVTAFLDRRDQLGWDGPAEGRAGHFEHAWLDPDSGKVFCLSSGPSKEAVLRIHEKAGHPTSEIYELPVEVEY